MRSILVMVCVLAAMTATMLTSPAHASSGSGCTYTVQRGDWLSRIAARTDQSWQRLAALNHLANPNRIYPGQMITVCDAAPSGNGNSGGQQRHYPNMGAYGQCMWYISAQRSDLWLGGIHAAKDVPWAMRARGYATGYVPRVGAIVVYQPGVEGADWHYGHVAIVWAVYGNGTFLIREMNAYGWLGLDGRPSGWNRVDQHLSRVEAGVSFVY